MAARQEVHHQKGGACKPKVMAGSHAPTQQMGVSPTAAWRRWLLQSIDSRGCSWLHTAPSMKPLPKLTKASLPAGTVKTLRDSQLQYYMSPAVCRSRTLSQGCRACQCTGCRSCSQQLASSVLITPFWTSAWRTTTPVQLLQRQKLKQQVGHYAVLGLASVSYGSLYSLLPKLG